MAVETYQVYPDTPHRRVVLKAVEIIKKGGVIVYPTDTVYGLGCDLYNKKALDRIVQIKKLQSKKPLSFILPDLKNISHYAHVPDHAYKVMKRVTPGAYTFILTATKEVPKLMLQKRKTVGIRIPDTPLALQIIEELGNPILSTSVPLGEDDFYTDPDEIFASYGNQLDLILDAGITYNNPSTIIDFTGDEPEIIREGSGDVNALNY